MEKHKAVIMGRKGKQDYYYCRRWKDVTSRYKTLDNVKIWEGELDTPPLNVGEYIYINNLDKTVKVEQKIRTTNNEIIYYSDFIVELIIDEESKIQAEIEKKEIEKRYEEHEKFLMESHKKIKPVKKWYQFWK